MQDTKPTNSVLSHLRANLWLVVLTIVICCVLYPAAVWVVGQVVFHNQAQGDLIDKDGNPTSDDKQAVGSKLIAQSFNSPWFFQSRPSATSPSYNAAASGGSNLGASSPKLRGRVAQLLGTISRYSDAYKKSHLQDGNEPNPQDDIKTWFKAQTDAKRDLFTEWANNNSTLAQAWATGTASIKDYIQDWADKHPNVVEAWKKANPGVTKKPGSDDLVAYFFTSYEKEYFGKWPTQEAPGDVTTRIAAWAKDHPDLAKKWKEANPDKGEPKDTNLVAFFYQDYPNNSKDWPPLDPGEWVDAAQTATVKPDAQDSDVEGTFFDTWLTEKVKAKELDPLKDFEQVPADMVTTSGSGLDPDVSLANARYQRETVVQGNVDHIVKQFEDAEENKKANRKVSDDQKAKLKDQIGKVVDGLLVDLGSRPMFGLTGDRPLVNVLQLNLHLQAEMKNIKVQ